MPYTQCLSLSHQQSSVQKPSAQSYTALYVSRYICSSVSFKSKLLRHASGKFPLNGSLNRLYFSFCNRSINTSKHTGLMFLHRLHVANKISAEVIYYIEIWFQNGDRQRDAIQSAALNNDGLQRHILPAAAVKPVSTQSVVDWRCPCVAGARNWCLLFIHPAAQRLEACTSWPNVLLCRTFSNVVLSYILYTLLTSPPLP